MGEFFDAYRRGRAEARTKYGPAPPFFRKKFAKPPHPAPRHDGQEEYSDCRDAERDPAPPGVEGDEQAIRDLIAQSEALEAENADLIDELEALRASKEEADSELVNKLKRELRESFAANTSLKADLAAAEEKCEIAEQACTELREEIAAFENEGRKRQGRGRA